MSLMAKVVLDPQRSYYKPSNMENSTFNVRGDCAQRFMNLPPAFVIAEDHPRAQPVYQLAEVGGHR